MTKSKNTEENSMIRKSMIALAAIGTLATVALAPTSASAWGFKHHGWGHGWGHHGWHGGWGFYGPRYITVGPDCYYVKRYTRSGNVRLIKVCN
jgi:hypothetical protein